MKLRNVGEFSIDTETNSLDPHQAEFVGISISIISVKLVIFLLAIKKEII